jgi:hypothetical protein
MCILPCAQVINSFENMCLLIIAYFLNYFFYFFSKINIFMMYASLTLILKLPLPVFFGTDMKIVKLANINPLTPELNPSAQGCLPRFFTGGF